MIFDRFDHYRMLLIRSRDLHPAGMADGGVGDIAVTCDLV
jgi:hypothetical protein